MIDPTSFGFVACTAVLIVVISIAVFRMYPKETDFEKAYGANALRLLADDRMAKTKNTKSKNRAKIAEKKKDAGGEEKERRDEKSENDTVFYVPLSTTDSSGTQKWSGVDNGGEIDMKPSRKKYKSKQPTAETKQHKESERTENDAVSKNMNGPLQLQGVETMNAEPNITLPAKVFNDEVGERKARRKNRARRAEENGQIRKIAIGMVEEINVTAEAVKPVGSDGKKAEKLKPNKADPLNDINTDRFQTRLNAVSELEPEYIIFISNYISDVNTQKARFCDEIALLRKQIADKDRLVVQCTSKLTVAQQKDSEIALLQKALAEEKKKYKLFEQTVCTQMSNSVQEKSYLQRKYDQLHADLGALREELKRAQSVIHSTPAHVDTKAYQQQIDLLKVELTSNKSRCSQLEVELNQRLQAFQQIKNESQNQDLQIERLNKANILLEKRLQDVEGSAKTERDALEMKLKNTIKMAEELSAVTSEIRAEMLQHKENAEIAVREREEYCEQIRVLNARLVDTNRERENCLNKCANYSTELAKMETANKELSSQLQMLQDASAANGTNYAELARELEKCRKQLADSVKAHEEETTKLKNELARIQEEKEKCEKDMSLDLFREVAEVTQCRKELDEFRNEYNKKLNHIVFLEEEIAIYKKIEEERQTQYGTMMSPVEREAPNFSYLHGTEMASGVTIAASSKNLELEVGELKKQNEELREVNYKIVEISQQQEIIFKEHLEELKETYEKTLRQYCNETFTTLSTVLPSNVKLSHLPNSFDMKHFFQWLNDVKNMLQKNKSARIVEVNNNNFEQYKINKDSHCKRGMSSVKVAELEISNRRYRAALTVLSSLIDTIEQEAILKEKAYLNELSRLRHEISKQLKKQLENERKRKQELISQAFKLCEVINGPSKPSCEKADPCWKPKSACDAGGSTAAANIGWETVEE